MGTLSGNQEIHEALGISPGELLGSVWKKGGAQPGRRFGAVKPVRLGSAPLSLKSLRLSYTVKSQRLAGTLVCVNEGSINSGRKRQRSDFSDIDSDEDEGFNSIMGMFGV